MHFLLLKRPELSLSLYGQDCSESLNAHSRGNIHDVTLYQQMVE